jgi:pimeloyl-ACP methyl ester carboxylesterase
MPYINKDNLPIHYHVKGSGPALVQLHGFTGSLVDFNMEPYLQLAEHYTLIQIDLRGHGLSMKSHDPDDYQIKYFVDDLVAILDTEGFDKANVMGFSLGGILCYAFHKHLRQRINSLIVVASHPYRFDSPIEVEFLRGLNESLEQGMEAMVARAEEQLGARLPEDRRRLLLRNDHLALIAQQQHVDAPINLSGLDVGLAQTDVPIFLTVGTNDFLYQRAKESAAMIKGIDYLEVEGYEHSGLLGAASDQIYPRLTAFLTRHN